LIEEILCSVQRRGCTPDEPALKLKLALEHLLEQFGLVLQRSHQIASGSGRAGSQRAGDPELADMPDQRAWRVDRTADYGPLNTAARGRLDLQKIQRHWPDILRVVASIYTGAVRAYDVTRVLQRDGNPTPLGEAIQHYGRIFKSLHILQLIDDEPYRRDVKWIRNLPRGPPLARA
jgi:Tn3 transposase DDE domain